jgi:hypothetical protein
MKRFLSYSWSVSVNLFYLVVVLVVLFNTKDASERAILSALGMIYVLIRSIAIGQSIAYANIMAAVEARLDQIQYRVDGTFEMPDHREARSALDHQHTKLYIDAMFLGLVSIACLWSFFTAH